MSTTVNLSSLSQASNGDRVLVQATVTYFEDAISLQGNPYRNIVISDKEVSRFVRMVGERIKDIALGRTYRFALQVLRNEYQSVFFVQDCEESVGAIEGLPRIGTYPSDYALDGLVVNETLTLGRVLSETGNSKRVQLERKSSPLVYYLSLWPQNLPPGVWADLESQESRQIRIERALASRKQGRDSISLRLVKNLSNLTLIDEC